MEYFDQNYLVNDLDSLKSLDFLLKKKIIGFEIISNLIEFQKSLTALQNDNNILKLGSSLSGAFEFGRDFWTALAMLVSWKLSSHRSIGIPATSVVASIGFQTDYPHNKSTIIKPKTWDIKPQSNPLSTQPINRFGLMLGWFSWRRSRFGLMLRWFYWRSSIFGLMLGVSYRPKWEFHNFPTI